MVQHLEDLKLSVLISLVLEYFLDGHCLSRLSNGSLEDHTKRSISNDLLSIVGKTLLETIQNSQVS